jgi:CubicO group peptidase (beta-lactamase class C family)
VENQVPATAETIYKVGSITKQFTAAAVMQQVEAGTIDLDAPVIRYLPDHLPALDHLSGVTIQHLLNHTAGIPDYTLFEESWRRLGLEMTPSEVLEVFQDRPLDFPPGSKFSYSNSGYILLGMVLESVTGKPYGGLLNEAIFVPAKLESSAYCDERQLIPGRAHGYDIIDGSLIHARYVHMSQVYSAGAICSSALDLVRWLRGLSRGEVVSERGFETMTTESVLNDGSPLEYGMGLAVGYLDGHRRISHVGGFLGFMGQIALYPDDDLTVVVLTNTEGAAAAHIETAIAREVLGLASFDVVDLQLEDAELQRFVGRYDVGPTTVSIAASAGRLYADVRLPRLAGRYTLLYQGDDLFVSETDPDVRLTFSERDDGSIDGFVLRNRGIVMEARRLR